MKVRSLALFFTRLAAAFMVSRFFLLVTRFCFKFLLVYHIMSHDVDWLSDYFDVVSRVIRTWFCLDFLKVY